MTPLKATLFTLALEEKHQFHDQQQFYGAHTMTHTQQESSHMSVL
jgi:hypothetical protein